MGCLIMILGESGVISMSRNTGRMAAIPRGSEDGGRAEQVRKEGIGVEMLLCGLADDCVTGTCDFELVRRVAVLCLPVSLLGLANRRQPGAGKQDWKGRSRNTAWGWKRAGAVRGGRASPSTPVVCDKDKQTVNLECLVRKAKP